MRIQTFSILVGGSACNASCPFCVSRMTPNDEPPRPIEPNYRRFRVAVALAAAAGATTAMLTGKGEPTLWPDLITGFLDRLDGDKSMPLRELQTNGIRLAGPDLDGLLPKWSDKGLTTIALSVAHHESSRNAEICGSAHDIAALAGKLHQAGFSVRLCCQLVRGHVDAWAVMAETIQFARDHRIEQLTFTPINAPRSTANREVAAYVAEHRLDPTALQDIMAHLDQHPLLLELAHGARVYDVDGQNVCLNNCLNRDVIRDAMTMRNLIFHPNGAIRWDWEHEGARIL